ncbi:MAG: LuxR C-terminal-related transcriptional regulator [Micromonosporaceae bacterium]
MRARTSSLHAAGRSRGVNPDIPLETKLHAPSPRRGWLDRSELVGLLSDTAAKLILVSAPAGFGKTTLVAQWRAGMVESTPFAWISLDRGDNDPVRLWRHVIAALQRASPELAVGEILRPPRSDAVDMTEKVLPALVNKLAVVRTPIVLVLDDYHVIKERICHEQIEFLLTHFPPPCRIVLITRADPPLPLARLRATGDMAEIRTKELRFTPADAAALADAAGVRLGERDIADLTERTEGWPAGVYLAVLSLREDPQPSAYIRQFSGSNRFIVDFLAEEVVSRQTPEVRRFLMRTSILERFTAPLCDAVAETSNAAHLLEHLERENLFVVPMDDKRVWFRYHHLFAQMLRSQLERAEPGITPVLHKRASAWHQISGSAEEAVSHALSAGDARGTVDLIARHWSAFVNAGRAATVRSWFGSLGDDRIGEDPVAAHCAAWVAALCGDQQSARRWLVVLEAGQHDGPLPDGMRSLKSSASLLRGTFGFDGLRAMRESAATAAELEGDPASPWYALARAALGFSLYLSGETAAASAAIERAVMSEAAIPLVRILALATAALVAAEQGRSSQAEEFAAAAQRIADSSDHGGTAQNSFAHTAVGANQYQQGRLEEARAELELALRSRRQWLGISPWPTVDILLRLAAVLADIGDRRGAGELIAEVNDVLASLPDGTEALRARLSEQERHLASASWGTPLAEPLTEREKAVLFLLRGTLSLREIGRELFLSANTIKTHTRSIYRKLGASTRSEAVERAREAGITS